MAIDWNQGIVDYRNQKNYNDGRPIDGRKTQAGGVSQTVQGETMTIKEIMDRAMQGIRPEQSNLQFFDIEELDNIRDFPVDLTDLDATKTELAEIQLSVDEAIAERDAPEPDQPIDPDPAPPTPDPTP